MEGRKHRKEERGTSPDAALRAEQPSVTSRVPLSPGYRAPHPRRPARRDCPLENGDHTVPVCLTCQSPREVGRTPVTMLQMSQWRQRGLTTPAASHS